MSAWKVPLTKRTAGLPVATYVWTLWTISRLGSTTNATGISYAVPWAAVSRRSRRTGSVLVSGELARSMSTAAASCPGSSMPGKPVRGRLAARSAALRSPCSLAVTRHRPEARSSLTVRVNPAPSTAASNRPVAQLSSVYSSYRHR